MDIRSLFSRPADEGRWEESPAPAASRGGDGSLRIDCRACQRRPDPTDGECIRCISSAISREGAGDRIVLSKMRDTQITGDAASLICDIASVMGAPARDPGDRMCEGCERRPTLVMGGLWDGFPDPSFRDAATRVWAGPGEDPECIICLRRTSMLIRNAEKGMADIRRSAAEMAGGLRRWRPATASSGAPIRRTTAAGASRRISGG